MELAHFLGTRFWHISWALVSGLTMDSRQPGSGPREPQREPEALEADILTAKAWPKPAKIDLSKVGFNSARKSQKEQI